MGWVSSKDLPWQHTQHEVQHKKGADDDEGDKVQPVPSVPWGIVALWEARREGRWALSGDSGLTQKVRVAGVLVLLGLCFANVLDLWSPGALAGQRGKWSTRLTSEGNPKPKSTIRRTKPPPNHVVRTGPRTSMTLRRTSQTLLQKEKGKTKPTEMKKNDPGSLPSPQNTHTLPLEQVYDGRIWWRA